MKLSKSSSRGKVQVSDYPWGIRLYVYTFRDGQLCNKVVHGDPNAIFSEACRKYL